MLNEYIRIIKNNSTIIGIAGIAVALFTLYFTKNQPSYYQSSLSLLISSVEPQPTSDYRFDGYYTIQATDLFSNTVEAWIKSPEVVTEIYTQAQVGINGDNIKVLTKKFKAEKMSPHYIELRYTTGTEKDAVDIAGAITKVLDEKASMISQVSQKQTAFTVKSGTPIIMLSEPPVLINTFIGLVAGLVAGFVFVVLREYSKEEK